MKIKEYLGRLGYLKIAVLLVVAIILAFIYSFLTNWGLSVAIISMIIAVFGSYFIFMSFFEEEKPVRLNEGETMILRTLDRGYILFPGRKGGFMGRKSHRDLDIYLTDKRILARESSGGFILDKPLSSVESAIPEKKLTTKYLRVRYLEKGKENDVLLFVGDTDLWIEKLENLIKKPEEDESLEDIGKVKDQIKE